jgi:transposase
MTTIAQDEPRRVIGGVDTHKDVHVAAVLDDVGRLVGTESFPANRHGYRRLLRWMQSHGAPVAVGVEGCGSWGAGLARYLTTHDLTVIEVNRPNRQNRRLRGKTDTVDAEVSTAVETARPTRRCGPSSWCAWAVTLRPGPTSSGGLRRDCPSRRSCAV